MENNTNKRRYTFSEYIENPELQDSAFCLKTVSRNPNNLYYIRDDLKTYDICLNAVKKYGLALCYVPKKFKTKELCLEAVKEDCFALQYVKRQTPELCMVALKRSVLAFKCVRNQTLEMIEFVFNKITSERKNYLVLNLIDKEKAPNCIKYYLEVNNI